MKKILILLLLATVAFTHCTESTTSNQKSKSSKVCNAHFPNWVKDASIYEVNIRQYSPEGTFNAFVEHLPRLKELGVEILWIMPIHPIGEKNRKGTLGSVYSVKDYMKVNPEFGTLDDFISLVNKSHVMGFKVIIDWVANHTAWDHPWTISHPEWYKKDTLGNLISPYDWTDVIQLDYDNTELREEMINSLKFWIEKAGIDGYRCDVAGMVPVDFWEEARVELDKIKPVFMLAEDESKKDLLINAFNMNYGWEIHHIMNKVAKGEENTTAIWSYFSKSDSTYPAGSTAMQFTSNHDENSWNGTAFERMGDAVEAFTVMTATVPGMMLIYNGQEAGINKRLEFFEKDVINWQKHDLFDLYKSLISLRRNHKSLWIGPEEGSFKKINTNNNESVLSFVREKDGDTILVFINLSDKSTEFIVKDDIKSDGHEYFSKEKIQLTKGSQLKLEPWGYSIIIDKK